VNLPRVSPRSSLPDRNGGKKERVRRSWTTLRDIIIMDSCAGRPGHRTKLRTCSDFDPVAKDEISIFCLSRSKGLYAWPPDCVLL
jgi:hypothetical protein